MDADKLKALTARATLAQTTANEISLLQAANRYTDCLRFTQAKYRYTDVLPEVLLNRLFDLGKAELIREKEKLLSDLLGEPQRTLVESAWLPPVDDSAIGTLDSSDTWEEPIHAGGRGPLNSAE